MTEYKDVEARLAEIEAYVKAATPGPWTLEDWSEDEGPNKNILTAWEPSNDLIWQAVHPGRAPIWIAELSTGNVGNNEFLAHARTDLPALLAVARAALSWMRESGGYIVAEADADGELIDALAALGGQGQEVQK
jgi:hypothetical protein